MSHSAAQDCGYNPAAHAFDVFDSACAADDEPTLNEHLRAIQQYSIRHLYRRNETIFHQDDPVDHVYKIVSGTIRLCRNMPNARRHIVDFLLPGDVMGFVRDVDRMLAAEAVTDVMVFAYPRAHFERLARRNEHVHAQVMTSLSASLLTMQNHLMVLGCKNARERVASFLMRLADRNDCRPGDRLELSMSRQEIADHLGLTIETVSRVITSLRSEGVIQVPNIHQLVLRDMSSLRLLAAEG